MKICAIICEYNPFHFGHLYHLREARRLTDCDAVLCIMSGNFVQRGEAALLDKYERAAHAVRAGADAVVELPSVFCTSSAEFFASGAIKLLSCVPGVTWLSFGAESGSAEDFLAAARALNDEPPSVSEEISRRMREGTGFVRARAEAWKNHLPDMPDLPNNILGTEYARAALRFFPELQLVPVPRTGSGYSDKVLNGKYSSATAVRAAFFRGERESLAEAVPAYVAESLARFSGYTDSDRLELLEKYALLNVSRQRLASITDCKEGLENALKRAAKSNVRDIPAALTSRRYTTSRIRRILLQNLLGITECFVRECLNAPLYLRLLAVGNGREEILSALGNATVPLLAKTGDEKRLTGIAKECAEKDLFADEVFRLVKNLAPEKKRIFSGGPQLFA